MAHLTHCPVCSYNLHGLPDTHRCPECGFAYDPDTRVWRPAAGWRGFAIPGVLAIPVVVLTNALVRLAYGAPLGAWHIFGIAAVLIGLAYFVFHLISVNRKDRCACVSPGGVFVRTAEVEKLFTWDEIVTVKSTYLVVKDSRHDHPVRLVTRSFLGGSEINTIFTSEDERTAFIEAVGTHLGKLRDTEQSKPR